MTWLSRLLPQQPSARLIGSDRRSRQSQRRRRMSTLEALEGRTLLSNVTTAIYTSATVPYPAGAPALPAGARGLDIITDNHTDVFSVTENANGTVTVVGTGATQINSLPVGTPYTTSQAMTDILFTIAGTSASKGNTITLTGHGTIRDVVVNEPGYSATLPSPLLNFTATGVTNSGFLTINTGTPGTYVGGTLNANVLGSQFTALTIDQVGCCPAAVTLNNDLVPGAVSVTEGTANYDSVVANNDDFGATTISQFVGLDPNGQTGIGDLVSINDSNVQIFSIAVTQLGSGVGQTIEIGNTSEVEVSLLGFGITASQPNTVAVPKTPQGSNDLILIESITTYIPKPPNSPHGGPDSIVTTQGNGNDTTIVDNAQVYGNISVTQGNGNDIVNIAADTVGYAGSAYGNLTVTEGNGSDSVTVNSNGLEGTLNNTFYGNVRITQGNGGDSVDFEDSAVSGYVCVAQGNGNDTATVSNNTIGGYVTIIQGNGNDSATVESDTIGSFVFVTQGNGTDTATIDNDTVAGNIFVIQGNGNGDIVHVAAVTAGSTTMVGPYIQDSYGLLYISQGNGSGDLVVVDSNGSEGTGPNVFNNVVIEQGNGGGPAGLSNCVAAPGYDDVVVFEEATVTSELVIVQNATFTPLVSLSELTSGVITILPPAPTGNPSLEGTGAGNDLVEIGGNPEGVSYPPGQPVIAAQVLVGDQTYVFQGGADNEVDLGGALDPSGVDLGTTYLDVWTGSGGGGYVTATNTAVGIGSAYAGFNWVINGGGTGNTYVDGGGNSISGVPSALPYGPDYSG